MAQIELTDHIKEEMEKIGCRDVRQLFLSMWSEAKESPEYNKKKFTILAWVLEQHDII